MNVRFYIQAAMFFSIEADSEREANEKAARLIDEIEEVGLDVLGMPNSTYARLWLSSYSKLQVADIED